MTHTPETVTAERDRLYAQGLLTMKTLNDVRAERDRLREALGMIRDLAAENIQSGQEGYCMIHEWAAKALAATEETRS
jgi:hypothetical protein